MKIVGIICEYNPFHNGHLYHLKKVKELFPQSLVILVLNGYFLERGEISLITKENKTKIALEYGIDLVVSLPFIFGTQSADTFAQKSIQILESLHTDYLIFGSESDDLEALNKICDYTMQNNIQYNAGVKKYLSEGINYPTALAKALPFDFSFKSNDLLAISYIKAIKEGHYKIKPLTIKRTSDYLDILSNDEVISAQNIREKIKNNIDISKYIPQNVSSYIENISYSKLFHLLKYKIITDKDLSQYLDVDEGIEKRIKKAIYKDILIIKLKEC